MSKDQNSLEMNLAAKNQSTSSNGIDLSVNIAGVTLKNPITTASGTFSPHESSEFYDLSELGAMITKGVASVPCNHPICNQC